MISKLCDGENYAEIEQVIKYCLNDDVGYSSKPTELRNQRVYAIRVRVCSRTDESTPDTSRRESMGFSMLHDRHTLRSVKMYLILSIV